MASKGKRSSSVAARAARRFFAGLTKMPGLLGLWLEGTIGRKALACVLVLVMGLFFFGNWFGHFAAYAILGGLAALLATGTLQP